MKTRGIDFSRLSLMDAIDLAILIEEEARDRYGELADQLEVHHTADAARFFHKMVSVEELHRSALAKRRNEQFGDAKQRVTRLMIFDIEAPDYDEVRLAMTPRQALLVAMQSEVKAHDFFHKTISLVSDEQVRLLFAELRDEEIEHQKWIRIEMEKYPVENPDAVLDVSDEPVAQ